MPGLVGRSIASGRHVPVGGLCRAGGVRSAGSPPDRVGCPPRGGGASIETVEVDSGNVDLAFARHDPPAAIKTVCALLTTDAQTAIGNLPTPDTELTDELNTAYEDAAAAGTDCYHGAGGSVSLLHRSTSERDKLVPLLDRAMDRIVAITGHTPSTSTTQPAAPDDPFGN